ARLCLVTDALRAGIDDAVVPGIGRRAQPAAGDAAVAGRVAADIGPAERVVGRAPEEDLVVGRLGADGGPVAGEDHAGVGVAAAGRLARTFAAMRAVVR